MGVQSHELKMSVAALQAFLTEEFPQYPALIEVVEPGYARMRMPVGHANLRPGGTVSGPTMMMLADAAMYACILSHIGPVPLAVTTAFNINFYRRPKPVDLIAEVRLLKLGQRLAVGDALVFSDGEDESVAHASLTYAIPPADKLS